TVDALTGEIVDKALARGGSLIVTADHGNAEQMFNPDTDAPHTAHTLYDVPLIVVGDAFKDRSLRTGGRLADIFPTMLDMMGVDKPADMTGESLLA
ncbi:MAG: 2,3-bisphosphoglycerate-independent phosphoglycerate mutase, partial [Planctomycetota bacterium]